MILKLFVNWFAVMVAAYLLPGVEVEGYFAAFVTAIVLGLLNTFLKPVLIFLTLPITVVTLGLFTLVVNAGVILLAGLIVEGFTVAGFWWALLFSVVLSLVSGFLNSLAN